MNISTTNLSNKSRFSKNDSDTADSIKHFLSWIKINLNEHLQHVPNNPLIDLTKFGEYSVFG